MLLTIFWASPLGKDKKIKSNSFQLILFDEVSFGSFFVILESKSDNFLPKFFVAQRYNIFTLGCFDKL